MIKLKLGQLQPRLQLRFTLFGILFLFLLVPKYSDCLPSSSVSQQTSAYVDFCESGNFRRVRSIDCEESINFWNKFQVPSCICLNGMWKARATFPSCKSQIIFGYGKCWNNREYLFDSFQSYGILNDPKELTIIVEEFPNITIGNLGTPTSLPTKVTIHVLNGCLFQRKNAYCVEEGTGVKTQGKISKYKNIGPGIIVTRVKCFGRKVSTKYTENITVADNEFSPCSLYCETKTVEAMETSRSSSRNPTSRKNRFSISFNKLKKLNPFSERYLQTRTRQFDFMHRKMLSFSIDSAFGPNINFSPKPNFTYALLTQMLNITKQVCLYSGVPENFLEKALQLMGLTTSRLFSFEYFTPLDFKLLEPLLNKCQESSAHTFDFILNPCSKEIMKFHNGSKYGYQFVTLSPDYNVTEYHLVFDTVWKFMDLVHAVCFKTFRTSHSLFHKLEKGVETFFHVQLRRLWKDPQIPPHLYTYFFGSNWKLLGINLEKCLLAVYMHYPYRVRLERPLLTPEMRASSHRWSYMANGTMHYRSNLGGPSRSEVLPYIRKSMNRPDKSDSGEMMDFNTPIFKHEEKMHTVDHYPAKIEEKGYGYKPNFRTSMNRNRNSEKIDVDEELLDFNSRKVTQKPFPLFDFPTKIESRSTSSFMHKSSKRTREKTASQVDGQSENSPLFDLPVNIANNASKISRGIRLSSIIDLTCGKSLCK